MRVAEHFTKLFDAVTSTWTSGPITKPIVGLNEKFNYALGSTASTLLLKGSAKCRGCRESLPVLSDFEECAECYDARQY
jgi:hypothetical protein